jgi:hypothetical protein
MHRTNKLYFLCLLFAQACVTVTQPPKIESELSVLSQHVFRGVSQTDGKVVQALNEWSLDFGEGQRFSLGTFLNADGTNDAGDGAFPDGNGGQITRVEFEPTWSWDRGGDTFSAGVVNRSHPNIPGLGDTTEAVLTWHAGYQIMNYQPILKLYYDLEDGDGMYTQLGITRVYEMAPGWRLETSFDLSHADSDQAEVLYRTDRAGFGDFTAQTVLRWERSSNLEITASIAASTIVSNHLGESLKDNGLDDSNFWLGVGMSWGF